jgi:hypothetical protein
MSRRVLNAVGLALGVLCAPLWANSAFAERRVALIIGNSAYQNAPALPNPSRDARSMAAMFQKAGYDVVSTAYDVGNLDFKRAIRQFEDASSDSDIAVVYFAGHGIEIHGTNYVIPVDAKLASDRDADDEAITLDRLVESVDGAKRLRVIILDACRDNPFARTMKQQRVAALRGISPGLSATEPSSINTLVAYAAKAGSQAEDGTADHSPFATALVDNLFVPGLDVRLAFGRVRDEVLKKTGNRQEPFVYGSLGGGNIALVPGAELPAAAVSAKDAEGERSDYNLVEKIGTKGAWQVFLSQHPTGFYSDLARQQITKLDQTETASAASAGTPKPTLVSAGGSDTPAPPAPAPSTPQAVVASRDSPKPAAGPAPPQNTVVAALEPSKPPTPPGPTTEEQRAWDKIKDSSNADDYRAFIKKYPTSKLAEFAQQHAETLERAAQEQTAKVQAAKEAADRAAAQAAEAQRQAQLAEAKRRADEAARQKAEQDAALAAAQAAAKAAAQAQADAEREAALKRDEEAHQAALAALAEKAKAKEQADAAAKQQAEIATKKQAEQAAALAAAQQAAQAAEKARLEAERVAQAQQEATCKNEQDRLTTLQAQGAKARSDLKQLQQSLTCERIRPLVTAALDKANALPDMNTPAQIRSVQTELARVGCYTGTVDGSLSPATTVAIQHYQSGRGKPAGAVDVTDEFVTDIKKQNARICPLVCPSDQVAKGETCVAADKTPPAPVAKAPAPAPAKKTAEKPAPAPRPVARHQEENRPAPAPVPHVTEQASSGGGGHGSMIGVGF